MCIRDRAKYTVTISSHLSQVRQAIDGQTLKEEYTRGVRDDLTTQLTKRQRQLQDLRAVLEPVSYTHLPPECWPRCRGMSCAIL